MKTDSRQISEPARIDAMIELLAEILITNEFDAKNSDSETVEKIVSVT